MTVETADWETFVHGADIGVRGFGDQPAAAFAHAAMALTSVTTDPAGVRGTVHVDFCCEEPSLEFLLLEWLNRLVYETATQGLLFGRFDVAINDNRLTAQAWGEPIDTQRHEPAVEVKGATMTELKVEQRPDRRWVAQCVVDV